MYPYFSIIIPVYNAEKTLYDAVNSVLNQSFTDFELILVNDGSKDNSLAVCRRFQQFDDRIKVIDITNGGVSHARNTGIDNSTGHYICFLDADDSVNTDWLLHYSSNDEAELLCQSAIIFEEKTHKKHNLPDALYTGENLMEAFVLMVRNGIMNPPWSKCYRREIIQQLNLRFWEGCDLYEDMIFSLQFCQHINSIQLLSYAGYNYRQMNSVLTHRLNDPFLLVKWNKCVVEEASRLVKNNIDTEVYRLIVTNQFIWTSISVVLNCGRITKKGRYAIYKFSKDIHNSIYVRQTALKLRIFIVNLPLCIIDIVVYLEYLLLKLLHAMKKITRNT